MHDHRRILIIQTAFLGDVVLTLPLIQVLKKEYPEAVIDVMVVPRAAGLLLHHPDIHEVVSYDKRGEDSGLRGLLRLRKILRGNAYDTAIIPHRSIRSALLARISGISCRIGFDTSAGAMFLTNIVPYQSSLHEVERNLRLLAPLEISCSDKVLPRIYPSNEDRQVVDQWLTRHDISDALKLVAIAPGTLWNTKRWLKERFIELCQRLTTKNYSVLLVGGSEDADLCDEVVRHASAGVYSTAGTTTLLQSAELIRRCRLLVSNDSAPMHLALAMQTPVLAIFGATVPRFGFAPFGARDRIVETSGLPCRPCSIHGGVKCPITSFDCMKDITVDRVFTEVCQILEKTTV